MALARIFTLHLPFYDAKFTSKVEYQQPLGSLKTGIAKQINQIIVIIAAIIIVYLFS